jgi:hypothetical protein
MIKQLQRRFIRIAVVTLTVAMVLVVGIVNIANWISVRGELFNTLSLIADTRIPEETSEVPAAPPEDGGTTEATDGEEKTGQTREAPEDGDGERWKRPENWPFPYRNRHFRNMVAESNWFSGIVTESGEVKYLMLEQSENLDESTAESLVLQAAGVGTEEGFLQDYLFDVRTLRDGKRKVVLLNCETRLTAVRNLVTFSAIACACGILLAWLLVTLASRKAVEPTIRNMEQQKQFITNASHELKTPLTVISTNMELMAMEEEDNPWIKSTQKQTAAMRRLVDELVYLSRMEEENPPLTIEELDAGKLLEETAEPFVSMAEYSGREMTVEAERGLQITGDRASLQRLISTLCDNAVKYASAGPIRAEIRAEGKNHVVLRVSNPVAEPLTRQQCEQLFNRFYRVDESRSKDKKSGFGIGLAIAAAIAEKHGGRIGAEMEEDNIVFTCVLPREAKF